MRDQRRWYCLWIMVCLLVLCAARPGSALVISELMYHPVEDPVTQDETLEFIELYNPTPVTEDLTGWAFTNGVEYAFEPNTTIGPRQYLVVARDPNAVKAAYGIANVVGPYTGRLNNDGERVELSNANGEIVISIHYDKAAPWPVAPDGAGPSLILSKSGGDPEEASSWSAGAVIGGTPGQPEPVQAKPQGPTQVTLVDIGSAGRYFKGLKEPSPNADGQATTAWTQREFNDDPAKTEWLDGANGYGYSGSAAELQNIRTQLNDMNGKYISIYVRLPFTLTAAQIASFSQLSADIIYDDGFVLYLNGTRVGDSGSMVGDPPAFDQHGGPAGEPPMLTLDLIARKNLLAAGTNILAIQVHNATISGSSDCFACPVLRAVAEPPETGADPRARLVINELLTNSDAPPGTDWIEIYNPGPIAMDLGNTYLSDDRLNLLKYRFPAVTLKPGQFRAVREGSPDGLPFALDFSGEAVYLTAATSDPQPKPTRILDAVRCEVTEPDVTFGRFPDGSDYLGCLSAATFEAPNAQPLVRDIVINEIMYSHALRDDRYEYVELYNRGTKTISLSGWAFTDGIEYEFGDDAVMKPGSYLVIAADPNTLASAYTDLTIGSNLVGPWVGTLSDHSERIRLSFPIRAVNPATGKLTTYMATADEVTYCDGGQWPKWADGMGASLELRDPRSNNTPGAWADSDESGKTPWRFFNYSLYSDDNRYTRDSVTTFDFMMLNASEVLLDDLKVTVGSSSPLTNAGFENGESPWRILGNHTRSFVTAEDSRSGSRSLHLIATGHGDPGANRINQSISSVNTGSVTFSGWARWLRGSRFLLLRLTRDRSPVMPPRPSACIELEMPLDLGTPGRQNTAFTPNRGPDILEIRHDPVLPKANEPILVSARVIDNDGVASVICYHRIEGGAFTGTPMTDTGSGGDAVAGDGIYTATLPGSAGGTMRAFYIVASDGSATTRFPTPLEPSAEAPERTCMVRVGDPTPTTNFPTYRVWMSDAVVNAFRSRPTLSNELMDCTFIYNDSEILYNCGLRHRGSPFLRSGSGRDPFPGQSRGFRLEFNPDQRLRGREEIDLDSTEDASRGPLQERASYWFYRHMGLQYSMQEYVRLIMNGRSGVIYEDVQKIDGDYIDRWFPNDNVGYIYKIDDYFEYSADGTGFSYIDEGLRSDTQHPAIPETYRWHFEKRSHPEDDNWQAMYNLAAVLNRSSGSSLYEKGIEAVMDPNHFARVLAIRHAVGDWDSYGYTRGKNNGLYYALPQRKWYLLPWDIDFGFGSGNGANTNLFSVGGQFAEVNQFLNYPKYRKIYLNAFKDLVQGPWRTSYGTTNPPTPFDKFLDEASAALVAEGFGDGRRDGIKQFVRDRRTFIISQIPSIPPDVPPKPPIPPR